MKIEETNITSLSDYKKSRKIIGLPIDNRKPQVPAQITSFETLSSYRKSAKPISQEEARNILDPDGRTKPNKVLNQTDSNGSGLSKIVDFDVISSYLPNIKTTNERELIEFFLHEGYNLTYEQARDAIQKYKEDANLSKPLFDRTWQILKEFEERIKGIDISRFDNIRSIYEKKDRKEMLASFKTPDEFIPSKKSNKVTRNIAKIYVSEFQKLLPDYEIEIEDDRASEATNNMVQISISKDNYSMVFFFNDFLSTIKSGKVNSNVQCYIESPQNDKFNWHYDGVDGIMNKINKIFGGASGSISKDSYNEKGEPEFYIDCSFEAGPTYYAMLETLRKPEERDMNPNIDDTGDMSEEEIAVVKDMIEKDPEINKYYKLHGLVFVNSCIRDGDFNVNIATAQALLLELGQYFASSGEISFDYVREIINHIEEKNNNYCIDEFVFDVANDFLIKELNSNEDHHNTLFKMLDYVMEHPSESVYDFASNLADELFNFEEVDEILEMLSKLSPKKQSVIISKVNKLVKKFDESGELKPDIRIYDQLMHELH